MDFCPNLRPIAVPHTIPNVENSAVAIMVTAERRQISGLDMPDRPYEAPALTADDVFALYFGAHPKTLLNLLSFFITLQFREENC